MPQFEIKHLPVETKELTEDGHFVGFAAVYGNVDQGGDLIERGAFKKTISERNLRAPVYHEHKIAVGAAHLEDTEFGLKAIGKLNLDKQSARDAYSDLKFYRDEGIPTGMSIGYRNIERPSVKDGVRILKELKLYEVTLTMMPMNEMAGVVEVKSALDADAESWAEVLDEIKSGRKISRDRALRLRAAANEILSLLSEAGAEDATTSDGADGAIDAGPVKSHAALIEQVKTAKELLSWRI